MNLKSKLLIAFFSIFASSILIQCGGDDKAENKSMQEIQNETGIPVITKEVKSEYFKKELTYFASLSGIMQTTRASAVGGRIEKINYKVGDYVKKDDIVIEFPLDNPAVQYEQAKHAYENSKKTYERIKTLLEAGETSQANYDGVETKYLVDKRNYEMAKQAMFIEAPYDGVIVEIMVNEGDGVDSKIPLFTIAKLDKMKARVWASESEIRQIKKGMKAELMNNEKKYEGKVTEISLAIDPRTRSFYAEVEFDNNNIELRPGLTTEIAIKVYENEKAIIVPKNLLNSENGVESIYIVNNGIAELRTITIGERNAISVEVLEGLKLGDKLIIKGSNMISNGQKVNEVN
ncbi:MAG: efflux RND transporter periplasmic adaptor subunit [Melioribacteraceae bacterium]|nr:MAG: efflux RND transporter periplasmic adaptor subunit [Melioribacteraceae bacterium]